MKKIFTLAMICFAVVVANAQTVVLSEDFEGGALPTGWTTNDADNDGFDWMNCADVLGSGYGHNSDYCMLSQSYDNNYGVLYPDNWLITPAINLTAGAELKVYVCGQDESWCNEHWGVFVSTTGTNPSDFTEVYAEDIPSKDQSPWRQVTVDLGQYTGNVYVAFRHFDISDMYFLDLDDVTITCSGVGINENEAEAIRVYPNPANNVLNVEGEGALEICNILGQVVMTDNVNGVAQINISNLENGVYFVRINGATQKFIKK